MVWLEYKARRRQTGREPGTGQRRSYRPGRQAPQEEGKAVAESWLSPRTNGAILTESSCRSWRGGPLTCPRGSRLSAEKGLKYQPQTENFQRRQGPQGAAGGTVFLS